MLMIYLLNVIWNGVSIAFANYLSNLFPHFKNSFLKLNLCLEILIDQVSLNFNKLINKANFLFNLEKTAWDIRQKEMD